MRKCLRCLDEFDDGLSKWCPGCRGIVAAEELAAQEAKEANAKRGKITAEGELYIKRGSEFKKMICVSSADSFCGDSCPHFGDPENNGVSDTLTICQDKCLEFDYFDDERV